MFERVYLAANNGDIGGGEVMLLRLAGAMRAWGVDVTVVAPRASSVEIAATDAGLSTIGLEAASRTEWMRALRRWERTRPAGLLWCNGLVPAVATAGRSARVVHLHQFPQGTHRMLARLARWRATAEVVPSQDMLHAAPRAIVLPNWTDTAPTPHRHNLHATPVRVGLLGRLSPDKGVDVLAEALAILDSDAPGRFRLVLGGTPLFVDDQEIARMERALQPISHLTRRTGWTSSSEFFAEVDILVVPSVIRESFGLVAAEAMAARVPLIVSDAGGLPEVVGDRGAIVPAGDAVRLADSIIAMTDADTDHVETLHRRWMEMFSPEAGRRRTGELIETLRIARRP